MNDIVERVAKAIADKRHRIEATHNWLEIGQEVTEDKIYAFGPAKVLESDRLIARAAIEAMREPTDEMCAAMAKYYHDNYRSGHEREDTSAVDIWHDMIDAALDKNLVSS